MITALIVLAVIYVLGVAGITLGEPSWEQFGLALLWPLFVLFILLDSLFTR